MTFVRVRRRLLGAIIAMLVPAAWVPAFAQDAAALRQRYAALQDELAKSPFKRPLYLESTQQSGRLDGDVWSAIDFPFATVRQSLGDMDRWCDVLILHLNVKYCKATRAPSGAALAVNVGRKFDQPLAETYRVDFAFRVAAASADYLRVELAAETGPMSTRDYRIVLEAVPLAERRAFVHMSYSYSYGFAARMATQAYLATLGAGKVGFSVVGQRADGQPEYVDNVRGMVERNTMRYYLAIESFLSGLSSPAADQLERRLRDWFAATERYAPQLHEVNENEYLEMKRKEVQRQQLSPAEAMAR